VQLLTTFPRTMWFPQMYHGDCINIQSFYRCRRICSVCPSEALHQTGKKFAGQISDRPHLPNDLSGGRIQHYKDFQQISSMSHHSRTFSGHGPMLIGKEKQVSAAHKTLQPSCTQHDIHVSTTTTLGTCSTDNSSYTAGIIRFPLAVVYYGQ
jgi:hypothetical protein